MNKQLNVEMIEYRIVRINEDWDVFPIVQTNILTNVAMLEHQNIGTLECQNIGTTK